MHHSSISSTWWSPILCKVEMQHPRSGVWWGQQVSPPGDMYTRRDGVEGEIGELLKMLG